MKTYRKNTQTTDLLKSLKYEVESVSEIFPQYAEMKSRAMTCLYLNEYQLMTGYTRFS